MFQEVVLKMPFEIKGERNNYKRMGGLGNHKNLE